MTRPLILIAALLSQNALATEAADVYRQLVTSSSLAEMILLPVRTQLAKYAAGAPPESKAAATCILGKANAAELELQLESAVRSELEPGEAEVLLAHYQSDFGRDYVATFTRILGNPEDGAGGKAAFEAFTARWKNYQPAPELGPEIIGPKLEKFSALTQKVGREYATGRFLDIKDECRW